MANRARVPHSLTEDEKLEDMVHSGIADMLRGQIAYFAMEDVDTNYWIPITSPNQTASRTTYAKLFAKIGTTFGNGDGSTTFGLPNIAGRVVRAWDDGAGVDPDTGRAFGSTQEDEYENHSHNATSAEAGGHSHTVAIDEGDSSGSQYSHINVTWVTENSHTEYRSTSSVSNHTHTITVENSGGSETRMKNITLLACIKF